MKPPVVPSTVGEELNQLTLDANAFYLIWAGVLVFFMQGGFAMLETGLVRAKNSINIFLKNLLSPVAAAFMWYLIGYGISSGTRGGNGFIGTNLDDYALSNVHINSPNNVFPNWFYSFTFASNAATIASGAVAERTLISAYLIYAAFTAGWTYPVVAHWVFSLSGWLSSTGGGGSGDECCFISDVGFIDTAGSGVVHLLGGVGALVGVIAIGPRLGRFDDKAPKPRGHSLVLAGLGCFMLWFGWYGFNVGGPGHLDDGGGRLGGLILVNTTLSGACGAITSILLTYAFDRYVSLEASINGALIGLVSITGPCGVVAPWAACVIGFVAGLLLLPFDKLLIRLKIDDPISAVPVHMIGGIWGCLAAGLFAEGKYVGILYNRGPDVDHGLLTGGGGAQFAVQCIGIVCIIAWSGVFSALVWFPLKLLGFLRASEIDERSGLDIGLHGAHAYNELAVMSKAIAEMAQARRAEATREVV